MELTGTERAILAFEQGWWLRGGSKATGIREHLSMSPSTYYRRLDVLIDTPEALDVDPLLVRRLRRARVQRRRTRYAGPQSKRSHR